MSDLNIGYGRDSIEPGVAPLVAAIRQAGFVTYSSCEGHKGRSPLSLGQVSFLAAEAEALAIHAEFRTVRHELRCSWIFHAGFFMPRGYHEFQLGWTFENGGIIDPPPGIDFVDASIDAFRVHDRQLLEQIFSRDSIRSIRRTS
jgi:hypothetical protein